jgi:hypothetical protein
MISTKIKKLMFKKIKEYILYRGRRKQRLSIYYKYLNGKITYNDYRTQRKKLEKIYDVEERKVEMKLKLEERKRKLKKLQNG